MVTKHLSVTCVSGDAPTWDGAAVCEMVLDTAGGSPSQAVLAASIAAGNIEPASFVADPEGVRKALMDNRPAGFTNSFVIGSYASGAECSNRIARTLHRYEIPPAVLVWSGGHWVCAVGVETDVDPLAGGPYTIDHLWIHNPWPAGMSTCDIWIDYAEWLSDWLLPVVYGTTWLGEYVGVFDPRLKSGEPPVVMRRPVADGDRLIPADKAAEIASFALEERHVLERPSAKRQLSGYYTGEPELVHDLRRTDRMWWRVPLQRNGNTVGVAHLDARFGNLMAVGLFPENWREPTREALFEALKPREVALHRMITVDQKLFEAQIGTIRPWIPSTQLCSDLVWLPCAESRNPLVPFRVVLIGGRPYFLRTYDGRIFDKLHPFADATGIGGL